MEEYAWFLKNRARCVPAQRFETDDISSRAHVLAGRFTRSIGDSCMKDVECARFYNERVPDGLAKMLPLPKKPYVPKIPALHCTPSCPTMRIVPLPGFQQG